MVSYVYGFVNDPEIVTVVITWEDQGEQAVEVTPAANPGGSYLALRAGDIHLEKITGLDAAGKELTSFQIQLAPGK